MLTEMTIKNTSVHNTDSKFRIKTKDYAHESQNISVSDSKQMLYKMFGVS